MTDERNAQQGQAANTEFLLLANTEEFSAFLVVIRLSQLNRRTLHIF